MVWYNNLPYITLTLFPIGNIIHERRVFFSREPKYMAGYNISSTVGTLKEPQTVKVHQSDNYCI